MYVIRENTLSTGGAADLDLEFELFLLEASIQAMRSDSSYQYSESEHALSYFWHLE